MIKVGDYVRYKLAGYYPSRHGTVIGSHRRLLHDSGQQVKVQWSDAHKPVGTGWEWCDHLKVIATTETK